MASDNDGSCLPTALTDFVFDLCDSVTLSQITEEQRRLYSITFRELTAKYYATTPWPSRQAIAAEANGHPLFLAVYHEITHRHWHSVRHPHLKNRIEGWRVYKELFDELLDDENVTAGQPAFYLLPEWCFDIVHEFVYQFQGYCQYKGSLHASAAKHNIPLPFVPGEAPPTTPNHLLDNLTTIAQNRDAWAIDQVLLYLNRLISVGKSSQVPGYQYLAIFSSVALSRLECLLGDYNACLSSAASVLAGEMSVTKEGETHASNDIIFGVFSARLSWAYHAGISYLMLRRYKDATRTLGTMCSFMQRGFKTGQLRKVPGSDQISKLYDRMIALLAILVHVCPIPGLIEDPLQRVIREQHGSELSKIDSGEKSYDDLFVFACPKFISLDSKDAAYKLQICQFQKEMKSHQDTRKLRSYMKLYTPAIETEKLASFNNKEEQELISLLLSYKLKMNQVEEDGTRKSAMDIHYHVDQSTVYIDEAEKDRRFENYFMAQIAQTGEIMKQVESISTHI